MKKIIVCIVSCVFSVCSAFAQSGFTGVVVDSDAAPVVGAVVVVTDPLGGGELHHTYTDSLGLYRVPVILERFILTITAFGHIPYSSEVAAREMTERVICTTLDWINIDEVVVQAQVKPTMRRDGGKLVVSNIENSSYAKGNNAYTFLRYVPLLRVPPFEGQITVVGGNTVSLLIDGRRVNLPMEAVLKNLSAESIERIEIIVQPGSEYSASVRGSLINIVIKKRPDEGMKYSLYLADGHTRVNRQNGSFSLSYTGKKTYLTSGILFNNNRHRSENNENYRFYDADQQSTQVSFTNNRYSSASLYFNLDQEINKKNTIGVRIGASGGITKNTNSSTSRYARLSTNSVDSTYHSFFETTSPTRFTGWNANLNHTLKTGNRGSVLMADLDYAMRSPDRRTHNTFDNISSLGSARRSDFIQRERTKVHAFGASVKYNHVFAFGSRLNSGVSLSGGRTGYDYFFGNLTEGDYKSDPNRTNYFFFEDMTASAYSTFQHSWNERLSTTLGLRLESYNARGTQHVSGEKISRHETDIYPSLTVNYEFNDNNSFVLSLIRRVGRPNYNELNPFVSFISPDKYRKGNPHLGVSDNWMGNFSYDFFDDYWLGVDFMHVDNIWNEFTIPDYDNRVMLMNINYGSMVIIAPSFSVSKSMFKGYVYLSADASYMYNKFKGRAENIDIDIEDGSFNFGINTTVTISKKANLSVSGDYYYSQASKSATIFLPVNQSFSASIRKTFDNSSLSLGVSRDLMPDEKLFFESTDYGYTILRKMFWSWNATYSVMFGNGRVRNVRDRSNEGVSTMLNTL